MYFETNRANHFAIALLLLHLGLGVRFTNCTNHLNQCLPELIVLSPLFFSPNIFPISVHATVFCSQLRKWRFFSHLFSPSLSVSRPLLFIEHGLFALANGPFYISFHRFALFFSSRHLEFIYSFYVGAFHERLRSFFIRQPSTDVSVQYGT